MSCRQNPCSRSCHPWHSVQPTCRLLRATMCSSTGCPCLVAHVGSVLSLIDSHTHTLAHCLGLYTHSYMISDGVCYLTLVDKHYPSKVAFGFLRELEQGFQDHVKRNHDAEYADPPPLSLSIPMITSQSSNKHARCCCYCCTTRNSFHAAISTAARPYGFIKFGACSQAASPHKC